MIPSRTRHRWLLPTVGVLTLVAALGMGYLLFTYRQESAALATSRANLRRAQELVHPESAAVNVPLAALSAGLPSTPQVPQWVAEFGRAAQTAGLVWRELRQNDPNAGAAAAMGTAVGAKSNANTPRSMSFDVILTGDYAQVTRFITDLRNWERLVHASQWQMEPVTKGSMGLSTGPLTLKVTLLSYMKPESAAPTPAAISGK